MLGGYTQKLCAALLGSLWVRGVPEHGDELEGHQADDVERQCDLRWGAVPAQLKIRLFSRQYL